MELAARSNAEMIAGRPDGAPLVSGENGTSDPDYVTIETTEARRFTVLRKAFVTIE